MGIIPMIRLNMALVQPHLPLRLTIAQRGLFLLVVAAVRDAPDAAAQVAADAPLEVRPLQGGRDAEVHAHQLRLAAGMQACRQAGRQAA